MRRLRRTSAAVAAVVAAGIVAAPTAPRPASATGAVAEQSGPASEGLVLRAVEPPALDGWPAPPAATAAGYVLVDLGARQVIAGREVATRRLAASTVKLLAALTVRRLLPDADATVTVGPEVATVEGAASGLRPGDERTVRQLLEAALVRSGNDAVVALAVAAAGSEVAFVEQMRLDAAALGLDPTLRTSTGLGDLNRLSPLDLVVIADAVLRDPLLAEVVASPTVDLPRLGTLPNRNELVVSDPSVTGLKTGFTERSGASVVVSAVRTDRRLVAVVLGSATLDSRFVEASSLLDIATELRAVDLPPAVRFGCAGPDPRLRPSVDDVLVPRTASADVVPPSVDCSIVDGMSVTARVEVADRVVARPELRVTRGHPPDVGGDGRIGRAVVDLIQTGLRVVPVEDVGDG